MSHPTIRDQLASHIRALGIRETARRAGLAPGTVSNYLTGASDITSSTADRLAAALKVRIRITKR